MLSVVNLNSENFLVCRKTMSTKLKALWLTARPKTLSAALVPVLVGTALAKSEGYQTPTWIWLCALLAAVMIQVGTNIINDVLDFEKGADGETRLGDSRAAQQGWFTPAMLRNLGFGCFALALLLGIPLVWQGGWPILVVGIISLLMGYAYTGGPYPLAYVGLGDLFVIIFFGLVAVGGVYFLHTQTLSMGAVIAGMQIGLLATVLIAINNLRDLEQDRLVNKKTLAVRLGPRLGRLEVLLLFVLCFALNLYWWDQGATLAAFLPFAIFPLSLHLAVLILRSPASREYNRFLARAGFLHMLFGVLLSVGFFNR